MNSTHHITILLNAWNKGDPDALEKLIPLADRELKKTARKYMNRERPGHPLQPTDLVDEAWVKLFKEKKSVAWKNRKHFYSLLARRMRQILCDYADTLPTAQHTGLTGKVLTRKDSSDILKLHQALNDLEHINKRAAKVVELRYFGGYTVEQVAEILDLGQSTVEREWRFAKAWLWRELSSDSNYENSNLRGH